MRIHLCVIPAWVITAYVLIYHQIHINAQDCTHGTIYNIKHIPPMTPWMTPSITLFTTHPHQPSTLLSSTFFPPGSSCQRCTRSSRSSSLDFCAKRAGWDIDIKRTSPAWPLKETSGGGSSSLQTYQDLGTGRAPWFFRKPWACWNNMFFFCSLLVPSQVGLLISWDAIRLQELLCLGGGGWLTPW